MGKDISNYNLIINTFIRLTLVCEENERTKLKTLFLHKISTISEIEIKVTEKTNSLVIFIPFDSIS